MPRQRSARLFLAALAAPALLFAMSPAFTRPQEPVKEPPLSGTQGKAKSSEPVAPPQGPNLKTAEERAAAIDTMLAATILESATAAADSR